MTPPFDHTAWLILSNSLHPVILWGRRIKGRGSGKRWGEKHEGDQVKPTVQKWGLLHWTFARSTVIFHFFIAGFLSTHSDLMNLHPAHKSFASSSSPPPLPPPLSNSIMCWLFLRKEFFKPTVLGTHLRCETYQYYQAVSSSIFPLLRLYPPQSMNSLSLFLLL